MTHVNPAGYLDYLEKEMTIMGILSTFFVVVPGVLLERVLSVGKDSIAQKYVSALLDNGSAYLVGSAILFLFAAAFFYRQRSRLAWFYGQIALEVSLPNYTDRRIEEWLKEADSWETWVPYNWAFYISTVAAIECVLAILSPECPELTRCRFVFAFAIPLPLLVFLLAWVWRNSVKFKYEEKLPYFRLR